MPVLAVLAVLLIIFTLYVFLICPSRRMKKTENFFYNHKLFAHRGLHGGGVPENSLKAFRLACENGYGIELDVHATADEKLVVFHDDTLDRMCGVPGEVEKKTLAELQALTLAGTDEHIPSLREVLETVDGRAVLIIEIKGQTFDSKVCGLVSKALEGYGGKWCIESFNPIYVGWWKKNRKDVVRGILSCRMPPNEFLKSRPKNFVLENMLLNFLCRPDFLAYGIDSRKQPSFKFAKRLGGFPVGWTARGKAAVAEAEKHFCAVIFENSYECV